jgi:predicted TIM-barrel fold metal-dependent hydrolase
VTLIDLHGHLPLLPLLEQDPYWGPFWEWDDEGVFHLRVGTWVLNLSTVEMKAAVAAGRIEPDTEKFFAKNFTPEAKIAQMDARGVDKLVVSLPSHWYMYWADAGFNAKFAALANDSYSRWARTAPDRLGFWAHLPMQDPAAAAAELQRAVGLGAVGAGIGGANFGGLELYDAAFDPLWEKASELGAPFFVHGYNQSVAWEDPTTERFDTTAVVGMPYDESRAFWHLVNGGVLDRFPKLQFYITHGGGYVPYQVGRFQATNGVLGDAGNARPVSDYIRTNFWFDPLLHSKTMRKAVIEEIGADRLLYGDNFGGSDGVREDLTEGIGLSEEDRAKIRSGNAMKLLLNLNRGAAGS